MPQAKQSAASLVSSSQVCDVGSERPLPKDGERRPPRLQDALGTFAAQTVLQTASSISKLRGKFHDVDGMRIIATFHPAYLLRNPSSKREVWEDMKLVRSLLKP